MPTAKDLDAAPVGQEATLSFPGNGTTISRHNVIIHKRDDGRWYKGTIDKIGLTSAQVMEQVAAVQEKHKVDVTFRIGKFSMGMPAPLPSGSADKPGDAQVHFDTAADENALVHHRHAAIDILYGRGLIDRAEKNRMIDKVNKDVDEKNKRMVAEMNASLGIQRKPAKDIAKGLITNNRPLTGWGATPESQQARQAELDRWVNSATQKELDDVADELLRLSNYSGLTTQERGIAKHQYQMIRGKRSSVAEHAVGGTPVEPRGKVRVEQFTASEPSFFKGKQVTLIRGDNGTVIQGRHGARGWNATHNGKRYNAATPAALASEIQASMRLEARLDRAFPTTVDGRQPGARVTTDVGPGKVVSRSSRSITVELDNGERINIVTGTPGFNRIKVIKEGQ